MGNTVTLDNLETFEFIVDKAINVVYVKIIATHRFVVKKYEGLIKVFDSVISDSDSGTYKPEMVNKIIAAMEAKSVLVPSDEKGYFAWLKNPRK